MDKLDKLPKWARDHIKRLERERDEAVSSLAAYTATQDFSTDTLGVSRQGDLHPLPAGTPVRLGGVYRTAPNGKDYLTGYIEVQYKSTTGDVEVRTDDGRLLFLPISSNAATVERRGHFE